MVAEQTNAEVQTAGLEGRKRLKVRRRNERERWKESREEVWRRTRQGVEKGLDGEART